MGVAWALSSWELGIVMGRPERLRYNVFIGRPEGLRYDVLLAGLKACATTSYWEG